MADPLAWLKLVPRARNLSSPSLVSLPKSELTRARKSSTSISTLRRPTSSRQSDHSNLTGLESLAADSEEEDKSSLFVRDNDRVWYNPPSTAIQNLDQMVETLQVTLLTQGTFEPLPKEYNPYILHLIEGLAKTRAALSKSEENYQELKQSMEQNIEQFQLAANGWLEREAQFKAEVKRLEVLLSKSSQDGLEAVTLARANSIVHRGSFKPRSLLSQLNTMKENKDGSATALAPITPKILDNANDFIVSERFRAQDTATKAHMTATGFRERPANRRGMVNKAVVDGPRARSTGRIDEEEKSDSDETPRAHKGDFNQFGGVPPNARHPSPSTARLHVENEPRSRDENSKTITERMAPANSRTCDYPALFTVSEPIGTLTESRHGRGNSTFSFDAGDDKLLDQSRGRGKESQKEADAASYEGDPSSPPNSESTSLEDVTAEKKRHRHHSILNGNFWSGKECMQSSTGVDMPAPAIRHPPSGPSEAIQGSSSTIKPVGRSSRDHGGNKKTVAFSRTPSESSQSHSNDSASAAASTGSQDNSHRQREENSARIAATLALAKASDGTGQKK
ncbi:hypothetical protein F4808DRAFT_460184 [Astrocystis sublimbata]|nr:hypothetical protein F4808DRAFT_460184 [Astrocystis sublimbata]